MTDTHGLRQIRGERQKRGKIKSITALALLLSGFGTFGFCSIMNLLNMAWSGPIWSTSLAFYIVLLALICIIAYLKCAHTFKFTFASLVLLAFVALFVLSFLITSENNAGAKNYFRLFCSTAFPGVLAGMLLSDGQYRNYVWRYFDPIVIVLTASTALYLLNDGRFSEKYALDYQVAGYMAAVAMGFTVILMLECNCRTMFRIFDSGIWRTCRGILVPIQFVQVMLCGGRGGALLALIFIAYYLYRRFSQGVSIKTILLFLVCIACSAALYLFIVENQNDFGVQRIISGYDNRTSVYMIILDSIADNPFFGYGAYGYSAVIGGAEYPHNIVLELLLTFGLLGLPFELLLLGLVGFRTKRERTFSDSPWLITLVLYVFVRLMVSATLLSMTEFWFVCGFLSQYLRQQGREGGYDENNGSNKELSRS